MTVQLLAVETQNMTIDGVSALAALVIAAFAVDRFANVYLFVLSFLPSFRRWCPEPKRYRSVSRFHKDLERAGTLKTTLPAGATELPASSNSAAEPPVDQEVLRQQLLAAAQETDENAELRQRLGEKRHRLVYYFFAAMGAGLIDWYGKIGILNSIGFKQTPPHFDMALTMLILTAGADRVAELLQLSSGGGGGKEAAPVEITGTLMLDQAEFRANTSDGE